MLIKAKLLVKSEGQYSKYIFEDLNRKIEDELKYIYCVKPPNWKYYEDLNINDIGYLEVNYVEAGVTEYYDNISKEFNKYNYNNCYFINFIKENKEDINIKEFKF